MLTNCNSISSVGCSTGKTKIQNKKFAIGKKRKAIKPLFINRLHKSNRSAKPIRTQNKVEQSAIKAAYRKVSEKSSLPQQSPKTKRTDANRLNRQNESLGSNSLAAGKVPDQPSNDAKRDRKKKKRANKVKGNAASFNHRASYSVREISNEGIKKEDKIVLFNEEIEFIAHHDIFLDPLRAKEKLIRMRDQLNKYPHVRVLIVGTASWHSNEAFNDKGEPITVQFGEGRNIYKQVIKVNDVINADRLEAEGIEPKNKIIVGRLMSARGLAIERALIKLGIDSRRLGVRKGEFYKTGSKTSVDNLVRN